MRENVFDASGCTRRFTLILAVLSIGTMFIRWWVPEVPFMKRPTPVFPSRGASSRLFVLTVTSWSVSPSRLLQCAVED